MDKIVKAFSVFIVIVFILILSAIFAFQTDFAKNKIHNALAAQNIFSYEKMEGVLPFEITFTNASFQYNDHILLIKTLKARPSLASLLRNQLHLHYLKADDVVYEKSASLAIVETENDPEPTLEIPYNLKVSKLEINNFKYQDNLVLNLDGSFRIDKDLRSYYMYLNLERDGFEDTFASLEIQKRKFLRPSIELKVDLESSDALFPFVQIDTTVTGKARVYGKGKRQFLQTIIERKIPEIEARGSGFIVTNDSPWNFSFELDTPFIHFPNIRVKGKDTEFNTRFSVSHSFTVENAPFSLFINAYDGQFVSRGSFSFDKVLSADFKTRANAFYIQDEPFKDAKANIKLTNNNQASIEGSFDFNDIVYNFSGDVDLGTNSHVKDFSLKSPYLNALGNVYLLKNQDVVGDIEGSFTSISLLKRYLPDFSDIGTGKFEAHLKEEKEIDLDFEVDQFFYHHASIRRLEGKAHLDSHSIDDFKTISLQAFDVEYKDLTLQNITLNTSTQQENWPFELKIEGELTNPIDINAQGFWKLENQGLYLSIQDLSGVLLSHPFISQEPIELEWTKDKLLLTEFKLDLENSSFYAVADMKDDSGTFTVDINEFPVEFLLLFTPYYALQGTFSLKADFELDETLKGDITSTLNNLSLPSLPKGVFANGTINGSYDNNLLHIDSNLSIEDQPYFVSNLDLPFSIKPLELKAFILKNNDLSGSLLFSGNIEDLLDLFDLGPHTISGGLEADLKLDGTFNSPKINGQATFKNGFYENAYTGTKLKEIEALFIANNERISISSFDAKGLTGGTLNSYGAINLNDDYSFLFVVDFKDLKGVEFGFFETTGRGTIKLEGDIYQALASGNIRVKNAHFQIPDTFTRTVPDLKINYIHAPPSFYAEKIPVTEKTKYPFTLDIDIEAPRDVTISGRGVESEWKGEFKIGGNIHQPIASGNLDLIRGSYDFSGKTFTLANGRITFPEQAEAVPTLSLQGRIEEQNTTILANLNGPVNSPKLSFSSIPPLPTSSILSLLLFGEKIGEISGPQAIQLATLIASLAGDGPDILESTRKSLGIDRLKLISTPNKEDLDALAVQVGKYITKGVLVTVTQGVGSDRSDVGVEVELSHGFYFQAESQQQLEQGKFTLKWNVSY